MSASSSPNRSDDAPDQEAAQTPLTEGGWAPEPSHSHRFGERAEWATQLAFPFAAIICAVTLLLTQTVNNDDIFITLECARNLAAGDGFVFNPSEYELGVTNPLVGLLAAAITWALPTTLVGAAWAISLLSLLGAIYAFRWAMDDGLWALAFVPLLFLGPQTSHYVGNEFPLVCALGFTAIGATRRGMPLTAGLCVGLLYLARFDAVLLGPILVVRLFITHRWRAVAPVAMLACGAAPIIVLWHLVVWRTYGQLFPHSLDATVHGFETSMRFGEVVLRVLLPQMLLTGNALVALLLILGLVTMAGRCWEILAWGALHFAFSVALDLPGLKPWHYMFVYLALMVPTAAGAAVLARRLALDGFAAAGLVVGLGFVIGLQDFDNAKEEDRFAFYKEISAWIRSSTSPDESIGLEEIGIIGFHTPNRIIDLGHLVTPPVMRVAVDAEGNAHERWPTRAESAEDYRPAFIVHRYFPELGIDGFSDFTGYEETARLTSPAGHFHAAILTRDDLIP